MDPGSSPPLSSSPPLPVPAEAEAEAGAPRPARVPVTIVTGFLGSGKTTLLRHVLTAMHGRRVAVVENEFADEVGIESLILKDGLAGPAADGFYELQNGCLCCTTRDGLVVVLEKLAARSREQRFDCVLIETSGLANPGPVAAAFWADVGDPDAQLELDGVVTVVDAAHVLRQLDGGGGGGGGGDGSGGGGGGGGGDGAPGRREAEQQIACADVVLLNKCDLVADAEQRAAIRRRLHGMNATARLVECERADVQLDAIMGLRAFDVTSAATGTLHSAAAAAATAAAASQAAGRTGGQGCSSACAEAGCSGDHAAHGAHEPRCAHDDSIRTVTLRCAEPLSARLVKQWVASLLWDDAAAGAASRAEVLRGKGILCIAEAEEPQPAPEAGAAAAGPAPGPRCSPVRHIFQSVQEQFDLQPAEGADARWAEAELPAESRLVFIGRRLDADALGRAFAACAARR